MLAEQRETQANATGHDFGSNQFKLVGVHILEMYNPMKQFYASQHGGKGGDNAGKPKKKEDPVTQAEKQAKQTKTATQPQESEAKTKANTTSLTTPGVASESGPAPL